MPPNLTTHLWHIAAAIFALAGLVLLIRWLIGDRSRGRRRCPKCWYDMSATTGLICPECGRTQTHERRMFHGRRRRRTLLVGISALLLAGSVAIAAELNRPNWPSRIPSIALLALTEQGPSTATASRWFYDREPLHYNPIGPMRDAPPNSWRTPLEDELLRRCRQGLLSDWMYRKYVLREFHTPLTPSDLLKLESLIRPGAGVRWCIPDQALSSLRYRSGQYLLTIEPLAPPGEPQHVQRTQGYIQNRADGILPQLTIDADALPPGAHTLRIRVRLESIMTSTPAKHMVLLDEILDHQIEVSAAAAPPVERLNSPEINANVPRMLTLTINPSDRTWQSINLTVDRTKLGVYEGLVYSVSVELRRDGECLARALLSPGLNDAPFSPSMHAAQKADLLHELLDENESQRWSVKVAAAPTQIPASCDPIRIWTGSITIPASSLLQQAAPPLPIP